MEGLLGVAVVETETEAIVLAPGVAARVVVAARKRVPASDIPTLRGPLAAAFPESMSVGVLKQCDEQTLVALSAVLDAVRQSGRPSSEFESWGVVACPRVPGRRRFQDAVVKFRGQGAWSVTPHFIPHCMLHSLSGLMSQALRLHGPNIGVGGEAGEGDDVLWTAAAWLAGGEAPGAWLVWTGWDRETLKEGDGTCEALVVGVVPAAGAMATHEPALAAFDRIARRGDGR